MAVCFDDSETSVAEGKKILEDAVEHAIADGELNRRCGICRKETVFHYEVGVTRYATMDEARRGLAEEEKRNIATGAVFGELFGVKRKDQ